MNSFKVCIGSNDNKNIANTHLGDTDFFNIYELFKDGEYKFLKKIINSAKDMEHAKENKMRSIIKLVGNVEVLVSKQKSTNFINIARKTEYQPVIVQADTLNDVLNILGISYKDIEEAIIKRDSDEFFDSIIEL